MAGKIVESGTAELTIGAIADGEFVKRSGTVLVGSAQGAVVADATDAASAITQLNLLLARVRAHGLIATT